MGAADGRLASILRLLASNGVLRIILISLLGRNSPRRFAEQANNGTPRGVPVALEPD